MKYDIDQLLAEDAITLTIKGQDFTILDLPDDVQKMFEENKDNPRMLLSKLLGCPIELLQDYGIVGINKIVQVINENFLPKLSIMPQSKELSEQAQ